MTTEWRDANGYPVHEGGPITRPRCSINSPISGTLDQSTDNSVGKRVNEALPWCVLAALFGGLGFGGLVIKAIQDPQIIDAKIEASEARVRLETENRVARAEALAELARKEASNAKDMVDIDRSKKKALEELKHVR